MREGVCSLRPRPWVAGIGVWDLSCRIWDSGLVSVCDSEANVGGGRR